MEKNTYKFEFTNISDGSNSTSTIQAGNIADAVKLFVKEFDKDFNMANIEFDYVYENEEDLGTDGLLEAETALSEYYT